MLDKAKRFLMQAQAVFTDKIMEKIKIMLTYVAMALFGHLPT